MLAGHAEGNMQRCTIAPLQHAAGAGAREAWRQACLQARFIRAAAAPRLSLVVIPKGAHERGVRVHRLWYRTQHATCNMQHHMQQLELMKHWVGAAGRVEPVHFSGGTGGFHRRLPVGAAAKGTPRNSTTSSTCHVRRHDVAAPPITKHSRRHVAHLLATHGTVLGLHSHVNRRRRGAGG